MSLVEIKQSISTLNPAERVEVAAHLDNLFVHDDETGLSNEWRNELNRRCAQIDRSEVTLLPWSEVNAELEQDF